MEQFDALLSQTIDSTLGLRCKLYGYQYSEIFRSLMYVYFCGGKERFFDDMNNGFGWNRLPKSFMAQNTVFLLIKHTEYIHRQRILCPCLQDRLRINQEDCENLAYCLKSRCGVRGFCAKISISKNFTTHIWGGMTISCQNHPCPYQLRILGFVKIVCSHKGKHFF